MKSLKAKYKALLKTKGLIPQTDIDEFLKDVEIHRANVPNWSQNIPAYDFPRN